jgi:hypothetical protein
MLFHLAQVNIAKMLAPIDSPVMANFVANLDPINALAESSAGFIWRLKGDNENATAIRVFEDDFLIINMSVWLDLNSLKNYVYKSDHTQVMKRRREWFHNLTDMHMALWYLPQNELPTPLQAREKLEHLQKFGETPQAFSFRKNFSVEGTPNF